MTNQDFTLEKALTDAYISELNPKAGLSPNVNAEGGEYVMTPDGSVLEVWGNKHKNGGVNMLLPSMTAILSDTKDLTITKSDVKKLEKDYGLKGLKTSMTYSDVLDRFSRKIGRTKVVNEIEDYMGKIRQQSDKRGYDEAVNKTVDFNINFIGKKIQDLKIQADEKENMMRDMFITMFASQQKRKPSNGKEVTQDYAPQDNLTDAQKQQTAQQPLNQEIYQEQYSDPNVEGALTEQQVFELGGYVNNVRSLSKKYNWTEAKTYELLKSKNMIPKFQGGGIVIDYGSNAYQGEERVHQSANQTAYGKVNAQTALEQLYKQFPLIFRRDEYKDLISFDNNGQPKIKDSLSLNKKNEVIRSLQRAMDSQMRASATRIVEDTSNLFTSEQKAQARKYLEEETFNEDKTARGFDALLGNFTSGRTALGLSLVTPTELRDLQSKGIYSYKQLLENPDVLNSLSDNSKKNVEEIGSNLPQDADYRISQYTPQVPSVTIPSEEVTPTRDRNGEPIIADLNIPNRPRTRIPRAYWSPDQSVPPPSPLLPETLEQIELQRIDPIRVGIEPVLQRIGEERNFVAKQLEGMPSSQRASVLANVVANSQKAESDAIMNATAKNAANFAQTEQYNISKADQETTANAQMRLNYEARALRGLDNYEKDMFNYLMANRNIYLNEYENQINLNRIDQMFPEITLDNFGIGYYYDPATPFALNNNNTDYMKALQILSQQYNSPYAKKKG